MILLGLEIRMPPTRKELEEFVGSLTTDDQLAAGMDLIVRMTALYNAGYPTFAETEGIRDSYDYDQLSQLREKGIKFKGFIEGKIIEAKEKKQAAFTRYIDIFIEVIQKNAADYLPPISEFKRLLSETLVRMKSNAHQNAAAAAAALQPFSAWTPAKNASAWTTFTSPQPSARPPGRAAAAAAAPLRPVAPPRAPPMPRATGADPFQNLSEDQKMRLRTLEGLNEYIGSLYPVNTGPAAPYKNRAGRLNIRQFISQCTEQPLRRTLDLWRTIDSAGHKNDCLVESFLTATCPAYRKLLSKEHVGARPEARDIVGDCFRRTFLPTLPEFQGRSQELAELRGGGFLSETHLSIICEVYGVDILMFEAGTLGGRAAATIIGENNSQRLYVILNPDNAHYEAVQPRRDDHDDFSITRGEVDAIVRCIGGSWVKEGRAAEGIGERLCEHPFGAVVTYRGGPRRVMDSGVEYVGSNTNQRPVCAGYLLGTEDQYNRFNALPAAQKEGTATLLAYCLPENSGMDRRGNLIKVYIPPEEVSGGGGGAAAAARAANVGAFAGQGTRIRMAAAAVSNAQKAANANAARRLAQEKANAALAAKLAQEAANAEYARQLAAEWGATPGGSRRRRKRSLRAKRRHTSKGKQHGSRRKR